MIQMRNDKKTILYYPTIKIKDGYWLRNAILYWDKVASIVPGMNYSEFNSIEVEFLRRVGIYEPVYPIMLQDNEEICRKFCQEVKENIKYRKEIKQKRGSRYAENKERYSKVHIEKMSMSMNSMIHIDKVPSSMLDFLLEEGVALRNCDGPWIDMRMQDANIYMSVLAKYLAALQRDMVIGTDKTSQFHYPYIRTTQKSTVEKQIFLDVALQEILPMPNMNIPLEDIIEFKLEHGKQLCHFRRRLEEFQWNLTYCSNTEDLIERTKMFRNDIADELNEIDELIKSKNMRTIKRTVRTMIPVAITTGVELLAFRGKVSQEGLIAANTILGVATSLFGSAESVEYNEKNSYLFAARDAGMISNSYRKSSI